ncbi:cell division protein PerM [Actinoplanes sp. HUAS TT8]|uniref:cell division protein PerM n=1 Tax=Actinoplanes sp. HUAS TT8 TaxID=3447453 RepID=UPI003F51BB63
MPSTTDRPGGSEDPFAVAEALQSVVRDTEEVPVGEPPEPAPEARDTVIVDDAVLGRRETVRVPTQRRPSERRPRGAPLPVAVAFATLWAAALTYLPVAAALGLARTLEGQGGLAGAAHAGAAAWLLGHGVSIGTSIGSLGLMPMLLTGLVLWRLNRAGLHVTRAIGARRSGSIGSALLVALCVGATYAGIGALTAHFTDGRGTEVSTAKAASDFLLLGVLGALIGSLRGSDSVTTLARRVPSALRHGVRTGLVAGLLMVGAGAAVGGLSVALGGGDAAKIIAAYHTGVAGQAGITLISVAYAANAAIWATAYLLGPGFALGVGSSIRLTEFAVGDLPTLPLLAGLPNGPQGSGGTLLLALPVVAGAVAGWGLTQRLRYGRAHAWGPGRGSAADAPEPAWSLLIGAGVLAGPVAGLLLGALAWCSGGPVGGGRLAEIGPEAVPVGLVAMIVAAISVIVGASAARIFSTPRRPAPAKSRR